MRRLSSHINDVDLAKITDVLMKDGVVKKKVEDGRDSAFTNNHAVITVYCCSSDVSFFLKFQHFPFIS